MKTFRSIFILSAILCAVSQARPPVLSLAQVALQKIDADIQPDHDEIDCADLDADGKEVVLLLMNGKSSYFSSGGATPRLSVLSFDGKSYPPGAGEANASLRDDDKLLLSEPIPLFDQIAIFHGISFKITSPNLRTANTITITPGGLEDDNRSVTIEIMGNVIRVETGHINVDGSPEIYIYAQDGEGTNLIAYSANQKKSLGQIFLPDLTEDVKNATGYRGHDEFAVVENSLARRFPIFPEDESETKPTGKMRPPQYKLHPSEAGWVLKVENGTEFIGLRNHLSFSSVPIPTEIKSS